MNPVALLLALSTGIAGPALANADLAQKKNCLSCHAVDSKRIGPSYKDIAAKYKGQDVKATLVQKVRTGGKGKDIVLRLPRGTQICGKTQRLPQHKRRRADEDTGEEDHDVAPGHTNTGEHCT